MADGVGHAATVVTVHFDAKVPVPLGVGQTVRFVTREGLPASALAGRDVVLTDISNRGFADVRHAYRADLAISADGSDVVPAADAAAFSAVVGRLGGPYTVERLGAVVAEAWARPGRLPAALGGASEQPGWDRMPPGVRAFDGDAPPDVLAAETVRGMVRIGLPADAGAMDAASDATWILQVANPRSGVVYRTEVGVGSHEFAASIPVGPLEVRLLLEQEPSWTGWLLGSVASPVTATATGVTAPGPAVVSVRVRWAGVPTPVSAWRDTRPFSLA